MKKTLFIDCQVFQTPAWHRGMGKYSLELLRSLSVTDHFLNDRDVVLLFNKSLDLNDEVIEKVKLALPGAKIELVDIKPLTPGAYLPNLLSRNRRYIDEYIESNFPDCDVEFLILSLFLVEGATAFPTRSKKMVLFYDLIMLQYFEMYLGLGPSDQHFGHYKTLFEADAYLAISETVANDLVVMLGIDSERIVSINGGPIKRDIDKLQTPKTVHSKPFILMPTGGDFRKNNVRGVRGFEKFNARHDHKYQLVLTSTFGDSLVHQLNNISDDLIFAGNVTEEELAWYYENSEGILFPSEYEGLGLPILEGVDFNKPIACSDIMVFREISNKAFYYFNPYNIDEICTALESMMSGEDLKAKITSYKDIKKRYSWRMSARAAADKINGSKFSNADDTIKMKKAIIAPNMSIDSSLGHYVALNYDRESRMYDTTYYRDLSIKPRQLRPDHLAFCVPIKQLSEFGEREYDKYDVVEYHLNSGKDSVHTLMKALALPGQVYIHDPSLKRLFELAEKHDYISPERLRAEDRLAKHYGDDTYLTSILMSAKRVITHDHSIYEEVLKLAKAAGIKTEIEYIPFSLPPLPYAIPMASHNYERVGLVIDDQDSSIGVERLLAETQNKWGNGAHYKVFLTNMSEGKFYRTLGAKFPIFVPQSGVTDHSFESFLRDIDVFVCHGDSRRTTIQEIEADAARHHAKLIRLEG